MKPADREKRRIAEELEEPAAAARRLAEKLGLDPYEVNYWIVDNDEMNELIAYGGFQTRYPHWRWGMKYDRQRKQNRYLGGKAFEIVNNDDPAHAFLQESNTLADQKAVITHVEAHSDFFANNQWFGMFREDPEAAAMLERHAETIAEHMSDPEIERSEVEAFIDSILCLEDNVDQHRAYEERPLDDDGDGDHPDVEEALDELGLSDEVSSAVFDDEWFEERRADDDAPTIPAEPEPDLLAFLREHGKQYDEDAEKAVEFEEWQVDVLDCLRREAYYFAPQKMTKVMNEGWACVTPDTLTFTEDGLIPMEDVVDSHVAVSDGEQRRRVYDSNVITDHETVTVQTRRGFELTGSNNHRIRRPDGSWIRLDELSEGDEIAVSGGNGVWPTEYVAIDWDNPTNTSLHDVADEAGVSLWTVMRYRETGQARKSEAIEKALIEYDGENQSVAQRDPIRIPNEVTEDLGRFLGLLVGDGHVSVASKQVGFTAASREYAEEFASLATELFGIESSLEEQGSRWCVYLYSADLVNFLREECDLPGGKSAAKKTIPSKILRSPKQVVAEFLTGLFDADGYAGEQGAILSTKSEELSRQVQLLLTNFGILSRRREQTDGCYHVHLTGESAQIFADEIGFAYVEKSERLHTYLDDRAWFETETWTDEVVELEEGTEDVYDISVEETHRYAAAGLVNHNSKWESMMMGEEAFAGDDEFLDYADHQARVLNSPGFNPYKLGKQLWEYLENTANRREVAEKLLRVEGITWRNFHDAVDFDAVQDHLEPPEAIAAVTSLEALDEVPEEWVDREAVERAKDGEIDLDRHPWEVLTFEGLAARHYSLAKPQNRGFVRAIGRDELERISRYLFETDRYGTVAEALDDVDRTVGWERMLSARESHNDVTFVDEFLTQEFVDDNDYFTYEYSYATGQYHAASVDAEDVKKKLLLRFTNLGKPTVVVADGNFRNRNELLLEHRYNGVALDVSQARKTLERVFDLWGRPVNLTTIVKDLDEREIELAQRQNREPEPEEKGVRIRYDGQGFERTELSWEEVEHLAPDDIDYDTKPDDWLA